MNKITTLKRPPAFRLQNFLRIGAVMAAGMAILLSLPAQSQPIAATPCDPDYYDSLESRAWLEAQREITQNQNLIFKPDSVLEYTCFDRFLNELADHADEMFSENETRWGEIPGIDNDSQNVALEVLVLDALHGYLGQPGVPGSGNFWHTYLGGRSSNDYTPQTDIPNGSYGGCSEMNQVWQEAKCMNFNANPAEDGFFTFQEYINDPDHRYLPERCEKPGAPGGNRWQDEYEIAFNLTSPPVWDPDPMESYLNFLDPANCSSTQPIPTGVVVTRPRVAPTTYNEHICLPPGCHFVPTGVGGGRCQP